MARVYQTSRSGDKLSDKGPLALTSAAGATRTVISVFPTRTRQRVLGFGGALTESSATALARLSPEARKGVIDAYFSSEGAGYTLTRTHIASCDFSVEPYEYSTNEGPTLADFSIAHDRRALLPLLQDALATSGGRLKVVAAAWSAPAWMKTPPKLFVRPSAENDFKGEDPKLRPEHYATYALYLAKYLQAYAAEGVPVWGLSPQNEPLGNGGAWETMGWDAEEMRTFIRDHLGPRLEREGLDTKLMIFDHNKGPVDGDAVQWVNTILGDPQAAKYVWGTALHWYASTVDPYAEAIDAIHALDPSRAILGSEATTDGLTDRKAAPPSPEYRDSWLKDDYYWTKSAYDWGYWWLSGPARDAHPVYEPVYRYARDIIVGLNHWYVGWIDWNVVLDEKGGPNHASNFCAAPVMVNGDTQEIYYSPLFYVMQHFSKFIRPDAQIIASEVTLGEGVSLAGYDGAPTDGLLATAAKNTDGSVAVVLFNQTARVIAYDVVLDGKRAAGEIDAQALQTIVFDDA